MDSILLMLKCNKLSEISKKKRKGDDDDDDDAWTCNDVFE